MITLNDYLYSGDTIFRILRNYTVDLKKEAKKNHNEIDLIHSNFLIQFRELLEHNDFLTAQSVSYTHLKGFTVNHGVPFVKPPFSPLVHCIGVLALSRLIRLHTSKAS